MFSFSNKYKNKVKILNVKIDNLTINELLKNYTKGILVTPNVDHLMNLQIDKELYNFYQKANFVINDSQILRFVSFFLNNPLKEKISGSDFFPAYCDYNSKNKNIKIFLFGSKDNTSEVAKEKINSKYHRELIVDNFSPSMGFEKNKLECEQIINRVNDSNANVLVIGVGSPKQEKWLLKYQSELKNIDCFMLLGATIDFEAGIIKRAPKWISRFGLEWLFRIYQEPGRLWKRYLIKDMPFFWQIIKQKIGIYKNPI